MRVYLDFLNFESSRFLVTQCGHHKLHFIKYTQMYTNYAKRQSLIDPNARSDGTEQLPHFGKIAKAGSHKPDSAPGVRYVCFDPWCEMHV